MAEALFPSGEQFELVYESQRVVVVEVGGGLRSYSVDGRELLDGYGEREMAGSGRGQVLIPWPNRIAEGRYEFAGRRHQLALTEPGTGSAIHGLVRWSAWRVAERARDRIVVVHDLHPQPGYPFALALGIEYALSEDGLRVTTSATNVGAGACPYGAGAHPYLLPGPPVDTALLRLPARSVLVAGEDGLPTHRRYVEGTEFDFRQERPIAGTKLDNCFTELERDDDGLVRVRLTRRDLGTSVTLWADETYPYVMLYTGDDRPDVDRRSLAVEPMTCPPQALRTGEALVVLEPGESTTGAWGISAGA